MMAAERNDRHRGALESHPIELATHDVRGERGRIQDRHFDTIEAGLFETGSR
jgi:hypothetical protein